MQALQKSPKYPYSKENLLTFDPEIVVDMLLSLDAKYLQLGDYVRGIVTEKYGQKSERFEISGQLLIFPTVEPPQPANDQTSNDEETNKSDSTPKKMRAGHTRNEMPKELPRKSIFAPSPDSDKLACPCCHSARVQARQVLQASRYQFVPASFYIEDLYSTTYECPRCDVGNALIIKVPEVVKNGNAAPGFLAQVAIARDFDHIPFNRQCTIYARSGVNLRRSTLSDYYSQVASSLSNLYDFMHETLLRSRIISTDDTPVKALDRTCEKNMKLGRMWIYLGDNEHPVNLFDYTETRGRDGPLIFLRGYKELLQGDCFSGNLAVCATAGTVLVACLAHARRSFIKALLNDKVGANQALLMFQALYEIEETARQLQLPTEDIKLMREQESVPLLNNFHTWLEKQYTLAQPKSSFGKALFYCLNNWNELCQYVMDGDLKIDNNHSEREMKYIAMGRKAWLFFGSHGGGKNHAIVLSILSTCRRHGVEPWAYLTNVIQRLTENPGTDLEELLPYNGKQNVTSALMPKSPPF
jgi:transposase